MFDPYNFTGKNTEHVHYDPLACMRKYGYKNMYNIAVVLLIPWYRQEHIFAGFGILCRLVHFTNDISRETTFFSFFVPFFKILYGTQKINQ